MKKKKKIVPQHNEREREEDGLPAGPHPERRRVALISCVESADANTESRRQEGGSASQRELSREPTGRRPLAPPPLPVCGGGGGSSGPPLVAERGGRARGGGRAGSSEFFEAPLCVMD
ncbi:unnamed protein product [Eretmochelys imbricata]